MSKIFNILLEEPIDKIINNLNNYFSNLVKKIERHLNLKAINRNIEILYDPSSKSSERFSDDPYNIGVLRKYENNQTYIKIYSEFKDYIPFILLREAYYSFIPNELRDHKIINIFIVQKIEIDLERHPKIKIWKKIIQKKIVDYNYLISQFDRLDKFLRREYSANIVNPFIFFINYIRKNIDIIQNFDVSSFYNKIYTDYILETKAYLYDDEIIEALKVVTKIFYELKSYKALLDYKTYFNEFKQKNLFNTHLSLRKFTENMQWIKLASDLAPSYQINWERMNISNYVITITFNPILKYPQVYRILNNFPFIVAIKYSKTSFGLEFEAFLIIPNIYINDIKIILHKFKTIGVIIKFQLLLVKKFYYYTNLNYFRKKFKHKSFLLDNFPNYDKSYELEFELTYSKGDKNLSLLDWLIIDRIRYYSITGFGFERREGTLKALKADLINEVLSQKNLILSLRQNISVLYDRDIALRDDFINFLKNNEQESFFQLKKNLDKYVKILNQINEIIIKHPSIKSEYQAIEYLLANKVTTSIEENIFIKNQLKPLSKLILSSLKKPNKEFLMRLEKFKYYNNIISSCNDLKIFDLKAIKRLASDKSEFNRIYNTKVQRLNEYYENLRIYRITNKLVEDKLEEFSGSSLIKPVLTNTITTPYPTYFLAMIIKRNAKTLSLIEFFKFKFEYVAVLEVMDEFSEEEYIYLLIYAPNLKPKEKEELFGIFKVLFNQNIISIKKLFWSGMIEIFSRKDFYDFENKEFFYSKHLCEQYYLDVKSSISEKLEPLNEINNEIHKDFFPPGQNINNLITRVNQRISGENNDFTRKSLENLFLFNYQLKQHLLDIELYKKDRSEFFFKNYIKKIYFYPNFQRFGFSQVYLYFYPTNLNDLNLRLLLGNNFQNIQYPAKIEISNPFLIKYIFPYRDEGFTSYFNWLVKSKKIIREYCYFQIKNSTHILHFDRNLTPEGWHLDSNRFKIYFQNILFDENYQVQFRGLKSVNVGDLSNREYLGMESEEYKELIQIHDSKPINIKSVWATIPLRRVDYIKDLLKKDLIFPYLSLKNLELIEEVYIILPNVKPEFNDKLIKIFSFFNVAYINEIEGEYYIHGFEDVIRFENGFMIILHLPDCQLDEFEKLFDLIFEYMEIDHYVILNDLVDGEPLIKSIYGNLKFLKEYNPLMNLIWGDKDKRWFNHKLFDQNFQPQYPDLFYGKPDLCKRCGVLLEKGKLCAECLYDLGELKDKAVEELSKIIKPEESKVYEKILAEIDKLIKSELKPSEIIDRVKLMLLEKNLNESVFNR